MTTETATLLAVVATPLAVVASMVALVVTLGAARARRTLSGTADRLDDTAVRLARDLQAELGALERAAIGIGTLRRTGQAIDGDLTAWTEALGGTRATLERLDRRRLSPAVRAMRWAGALGRVALMWRTPGR